ncbi:putative leucine-rich repeat receptor-like protein kinase At2g19210 [Neltuma alba]|uniref:putative leucine-rich repeat receptor-like protein kinase At2g19210 n=1 Tax=Neltuma alba TaxID=207710 RepID=UPI0010A59187|nr:putative leucine-rich repeat receptor-like protein kinase At2g19210 [Prosopis alba]
MDCGAGKDYLDEVTGIRSKTEEGFIESGTNHGLAPNINFNNCAPTINRQLMTVRSFVERERNCYALKPKQQNNQKYLIRAIFAYGNYDLRNQAPVFDLYLGINYWTTVRTFPNGPQIFPTEIIMQQDGTREMVQVCLVNTEQGTPFINALDLRPLSNSLYLAPLPLIVDFTFPVRMDLGSGLMPTDTRYKDDVYDRLWWNNDNTDWDLLKTREEAKVEDSLYELPREALRTASQPQNHSTLLTANFSYWRYGDKSAQYYMFLHFAEIEKPPAGHKRIINVTFDDDENSLSHELTLRYLKPITLISNKVTKGHINFTIKAATNSYAPPILNAFEIYKVTKERTPYQNSEGVDGRIREVPRTVTMVDLKGGGREQ